MDSSNALMAFIAGYLIIIAVIAVFMTVCGWIIYAKAGQTGWAVIVPIYNYIVLLKIIGRPWWWIFLLLIPIVNFIILIILVNDVAKSFGKDVGFTLGLIFLGIIFVPILAFGSAKYVGPGGVPSDIAATPQA